MAYGKIEPMIKDYEQRTIELTRALLVAELDQVTREMIALKERVRVLEQQGGGRP